MNTKNLPTKNNLIKIKNSIKQSKEGQLLLEQKKIILKKELEKYISFRKQLKDNNEKLIYEAYHSLKMANIEIGMDDMMDIADGIKIDDCIDIKYMTIMGVEIPSVITQERELSINYGLYNTTNSVDETILKFSKVRKYIIDLVQIENIIFRLQKEIEKVQRRSNALKEIIIPEDEKLAKQIQDILEENEREDFIRLKKLKSKGRN